MTKAEKIFLKQKHKDLKIYGYYVVTMIELEELQAMIETEQEELKARKPKKAPNEKRGV